MAIVYKTVFFGNQLCEYGVRGLVFLRLAPSPSLKVGVMSLPETCIYIYRVCCQLYQCGPLKEQWVDSNSQWYPVPAWTTGRTASGVKWSVVPC